MQNVIPPLAQELNETLKGSVMMDLLSDFGKRFYFPRGIITQSAEANQHAHRFNATVGMAYSAGQPMFLPSSARCFSGMEAREIYPYAPTGGVPELRTLWKEQIIRKNPAIAGKNTSLPLVVPGLTAGISVLADLFVETGAPVVVSDLFWGNYRLIVAGRRQGSLVTYPLFRSDGGGLDLEAMDKAVRSSVHNGRATLILNFPNNPTGYSPTLEEAMNLRDRLLMMADEGIKLLVIHDDAYFGLFYEKGTYTSSLFNELADAHPNILAAKVDGGTKEDLTWGFRVGFITFSAGGATEEQYEALTKKGMGAIRAAVSNCSKPGQSVMIRTLKSPTYGEEKDAAYRILEGRYKKAKSILARADLPAGVRVLPFNSGYFMAFDLQKGSAETVRTRLLHEKGIGTISIEDRYLRVAFSSIDEEDLEELYGAILETVSQVLS